MKPFLVNDEELVRDAYDQAARFYDTKFQRKLDRAEDGFVSKLLSNGHTSGQILDIGSGTGLLLDLCDIQPDRYCGLDISPGMVEVAHRKHPAYRFELGNMEDMCQVYDDSFNSVVTLFGAFSHSTAPGATISELWRVLRPGGKLLLMAYGQRYQRRKSYIMREKTVPTMFWSAGQLRIALRRRFRGVNVRGMSCFIDWLPSWLPQNVFDWWMCTEAAVVGQAVPTACYFLIATAIKAEGHYAA